MIDTPQRLAVVVDPGLPLGLIANTVATIAIGIGAAMPVFGNSVLVDRQGRRIHNSADRAVPILQAPSDDIRRILLAALEEPRSGLVVAFPKFARALHTFDQYRSQFPQVDLAEEKIEGVGLAGPDKWVRSLTGNLKLLR